MKDLQMKEIEDIIIKVVQKNSYNDILLDTKIDNDNLYFDTEEYKNIHIKLNKNADLEKEIEKVYLDNFNYIPF